MAQAELSGILRSISGTIGNFTFRTTKNGIIIADRPGPRTTPPTAEQLLVQAFFTAASKQWKTLTDAQRTGWKNYAKTFFKFDADGTGDGPSGQVVYLKAAWYQQAIGLALPTNAPGVAPPAGPTGITLINSPVDSTLTIRITHPVTPVTGHRLFVEITPPLASPARSPQPSDYRAVKGLNATSFPALVVPATNYVLTTIRFQLANGARFGCKATVVSPLGIPSTTFEAVLVQVTP